MSRQIRYCDTLEYRDAERAEIATELLGRGTSALSFALHGHRPKSRLPAEDRLFRLRFLPYLCVLLLAGCADRHTGPQWAWVGKLRE